MVVVGGGPAGMMAAAAAAKAGGRVLLLEKKARPGRKMAIAGGGRCNFTNAAGPEIMVENVPGNGKFLYSAFRCFTGEDCRGFFKALGINSRVEEEGKVFPAGAAGEDLVSALVDYLHALGVEIKCSSEVAGLLLGGAGCLGAVTSGGEKYYGRVIVATGGLSYPGTGSTGMGYRLAESAGHKINGFFPSGVALVCADEWIKNKQLQGMALEGVKVELLHEGGRLDNAKGDLLFTHFGVSGPAALRVSRAAAAWFSQRKDRGRNLTLVIDLFPGMDREEITGAMEAAGRQAAQKTLKNLLRGMVPDRLAPVIINAAGVNDGIRAAQAGKSVRRKLADTMKGLSLTVTATRPIREAVVTAGGVDVKGVNPATMESKIVQGLFFAGEVLDVDGFTGGFNMHIAFSTGHLAGISAMRGRK